MKILILEYASAMGIDDTSICAEGNAMLEGLLNDFKAKNADYLISNKSNLNIEHCNPIKLNGDLKSWLDENIVNYDACLLIAPEEDFILYDLTKLVEEKGVKIIGSSSDAVLTCSNKFKMYEALKNKVNVIKTEKIYFENIDNYKPYITGKKVIKPADGVSCSGVKFVDSFEELKKAAGSIQTNLPYFIIQDFIEGISASVSILTNGEESIPLSLNLQNIQFENKEISYSGGEVPFNHKLEYLAKEVAKNAIGYIDGLKGYVGVDVILGDDVYIVEINSRITTPYIALRNIVDLNLGEAIMDSVYGILPSDIDLNGKISFYKDNSKLKINKISQ
ncbi:ATP-grasp domain-containing protein [Methanobacterium sp. ACI-7]|uniref:ATP-grasp domain-containing protein n=1 Tax=unclassified Methanobacterium TaxID=2627676 RepID=UPI0039C0990C